MRGRLGAGFGQGDALSPDRLPSPALQKKRASRRIYVLLHQKLLRGRPFLLGTLVGLMLHWTVRRLSGAIFDDPDSTGRAPFAAPSAGHLHAIIVPAGGQAESGPPPHVLARLDRVVTMYRMSPEPKPYVITTAWGTPHKPCPRDAGGFERHEASDNARYLLSKGVPASQVRARASSARAPLLMRTPLAAHVVQCPSPRAPPSQLLEESVSLETVGNAYFSRALHTDVRGLRRLAVVNNRFHMPRTRAVFEHVFSLPPRAGEPAAAYELQFVEVDDRLDAGALVARLAKEVASTPRFAAGSEWRQRTATLRDLHEWVHYENTAYASIRLLEERRPIDPELLKSY